MARVSLVGLGWSGAQDYDTLALWWAAESGVDYGSEIEASCLGACGSGYTLSGSSVNGAKVYTSGVTYDGTNDSSLATTDRISLSADIDFDSIKIQSNNAFVAALNIASAANGCQLTKLVVEHSAVAPSGVDAIAVNSTVPLSLLTNSIIIGGVNGIDYGFDAVLNVSNVIQFGAVSGDGFEGIGTNGTITDTFSFNNSANDYINVTTANCASEDGTGDYTGYTSAELVDFASRDFRTKSTSFLATAGTGGSFVGAFLEAATGGVTGDIDFTISKPVFSASGTATLPAPSGDISFTIDKPVFAASGTATLPQPSGDVSFTISSPIFSADGSATLPQPSAVVAFSIDKPVFTASGSATLPFPQGDVAFTVNKPLFSATGSATQPNPTGSISFTVNKPVFSGAGSATLPNPSGIVDFTIDKPVFSVTGSVTLPYPQGSVNFTINNPQFSATGSVTLPQPSGSVSFTISKPIFSATGTVSGLEIPIGTVLTPTFGSNTIKLPYVSNTIKL